MRIDQVKKDGQLMVWATRQLDRPLESAVTWRIIPCGQFFTDRGVNRPMRHAPDMDWTTFVKAMRAMTHGNIKVWSKGLTWKSSGVSEHTFTPWFEKDPYIIVSNVNGKFAVATGDDTAVGKTFSEGHFESGNFWDEEPENRLTIVDVINHLNRSSKWNDTRVVNTGDRIEVFQVDEDYGERNLIGWIQPNRGPRSVSESSDEQFYFYDRSEDNISVITLGELALRAKRVLGYGGEVPEPTNLKEIQVLLRSMNGGKGEPFGFAGGRGISLNDGGSGFMFARARPLVDGQVLLAFWSEESGADKWMTRSFISDSWPSTDGTWGDLVRHMERARGDGGEIPTSSMSEIKIKENSISYFDDVDGGEVLVVRNP